MTDTTLTAAQPSDTHAPGWALAYCAAAGPREGDFLIKIDNEYEYVEWRGDQFAVPWQVKRGFLGSTPAAHSQGATVTIDPSLGGAGGSLSATDGTTTVNNVASLRVPSLADAGDGLAIAYPVVISDADPGAIGPGQLWLNTTQDAFDDLSNFPLFVRNQADDGWLPVMGDAVGDINLSSYAPDGNSYALLQLRASTGAMTLNVIGHGPSGASGMQIGDAVAGQSHMQLQVGGHNALAITDTGVTALITMPVLGTSDPHSVGALWNDTGTVKVSAG